MKKYLIIAAAALTGLAACNKGNLDVVNQTPDTKIGFVVANYAAQTKAESLTNADDALYQFHTYAYQFPQIGNPVEFMNTDIFAWDNSTPAAKVTSGTNIYFWAPENDYYWPKTGYISFYSYAGTQAPAQSVSDDKKTVTLSYTDKTIAYNDNFMVADAALRFNSNRETYQKDHVTKGVPTLFRHQLSKLFMDVKIKIPTEKQSANTIWKVQILNGYDIDGNTTIEDTEKSLIIPVNKGTLTLSNADALEANAALNTTTQQWTRTQTGDDVVSGWKPGNTTEKIQLAQASVLTLPVNTLETTAQTLLDWRTVMPQLTDNVALKLVYRVQALHGETVFMEEIRTVGIDAAASIHNLTGSIASWEANKKITYHIIIDPVSEKVIFDPAVEAYDAVEANSNSTINVNNNGLI